MSVALSVPSSVHALETARLRLVRADAADRGAVLRFYVDEAHHLRRWLPEAEAIAHDPAFLDALIARCEDELARGQEERWFLLPHDRPDEIVGYVFLTRFRREGHCSCELSYGIAVRCEGQGLMAEAVVALLKHAREVLGFTRIDARYAVENERSGVLLERLGFQRIGVAPQHAWVDGAWRDHVLVTRVAR